MNELVAYFVKMGMSPDIAVQIATQVSRTAPPTPPVANGIKLDPNSAVANLLSTRYGMDPHQAAAYAGRVLAGTATGGRALQEEAMTALSDQEVARMHDMTKRAQEGATASEALQRAKEQEQSAGLVRMGQMEQGRLHQLKLYGDAAHVLPENRTPAQNRDYNQVQDWARKRMIDEAQRQVNDNMAASAENDAIKQGDKEAADQDSNQALDDSLSAYSHRVAMNRKMGWTK